MNMFRTIPIPSNGFRFEDEDDYENEIICILRARLHGGRVPQIGEVTWACNPTYHVNVIKLK